MNIILDGKWCEADEALLRRLTPGVRKMRGVFETMLVSKGRARNFDAHYQRLCLGLKELGIRVPWTKAGLKEWIILGGGLQNRVRVMAWREGARVRWAVIAAPYTPPTARERSRGVDVLLVPVRAVFKAHDGLFKSLDYKIYRDAAEKAAQGRQGRQQGHFEAILVDKSGRIIDGSRTSLILLTDRGLVVAPAGYGTFNGLMRQRIVKLARLSGLKVCQRSIFTEDLERASACWLTNSLIGLISVRRFQTSAVII